ncbi:MAG: hypothetical protein KAI77_06465 [Gammaproteobacteria bacterium]|nr:hypothetical protein [Gammaproteobacteria bacterium]
MNYLDNIETLDKLLNAIDEAVQDKVEMGDSITSDPYSHYIIDKNNGMCTDITEIIYTLDEKLEELESGCSEKLQ